MGIMATRIVIANRNAAVAQALSLLLGREDRFVVAAEVSEREQVIEVVKDTKPELLLVDPALPGLDLEGLVRQVAGVSPGTAVVVLTDSRDGRFLKRAVESGARAYLSLEGDADELVQELKLIAGGHVIASGSAARDLSDLSGRSSNGTSDGLSDREIEVVNLVARGDTNREIAETLVIAENSVKVHLRQAEPPQPPGTDGIRAPCRERPKFGFGLARAASDSPQGRTKRANRRRGRPAPFLKRFYHPRAGCIAHVMRWDYSPGVLQRQCRRDRRNSPHG